MIWQQVTSVIIVEYEAVAAAAGHKVSYITAPYEYVELTRADC
jgi:hypothetical protein